MVKVVVVVVVVVVVCSIVFISEEFKTEELRRILRVMS